MEEDWKEEACKNINETQRIWKEMEQLAYDWEKLTNGKGAVFFELVTESGAKAQFATKNSKRKL